MLGAPAPADMAADVRRMAKKLRTFYCGHSGHFTADMSADLSAGVRWCPLVSAGVSAGVRRSKMSAVSADFLKKMRTSAAMSFTNNGSAGAPRGVLQKIKL